MLSRLFPRRSRRGQVVRRVSARPHREATSRNALVPAVATPEKYHLRQDRELRRLRLQVERRHEQQALTRAECRRDAQELLSDQRQEAEERFSHLATQYQRREEDLLRRLEILSRRYKEADQGRRRLLEEHETLNSKTRRATRAAARETEKMLIARAFQIQAENNERLMKKRCEDLTQQVEQSDVQRRIHGEVLTAAHAESEQLRRKISELEKNFESGDDSEIIAALRTENERLRGKVVELEREVQIRDQDFFIISARASLEQLSRKVSDLESIVQRPTNGDVNIPTQSENPQLLQKTTELKSDAWSRINGKVIARALRLRRQVFKPKKAIRKEKESRQLKSISQNSGAKADSGTPQKLACSCHEHDSRGSILHKVRGRASGFKHTAPSRRPRRREGTASEKSESNYLLSMASGHNASSSAHVTPTISSLPDPGTTELLQSISESVERENLDLVGVPSVGLSPVGEEQEQLQHDEDGISSQIETVTNPDNPKEAPCGRTSDPFQEQEQKFDELVEEIKNLSLQDVIDVPDANLQMIDQPSDSGQSLANTQLPDQRPPETELQLLPIMNLMNQARDYIQFWLSLPTEERAQFIAENPVLHPTEILSQVLSRLQELETPFSLHDQEVLELFRSQPISLLLDTSNVLMTFQSTCQNLLGDECGTLAGDCFEVCSQICDHLTSLHDGDPLSGLDLMQLSDPSNEFDLMNELELFPAGLTVNQMWDPDQKPSQEPKSSQPAHIDQIELNSDSSNVHQGQPSERPLEALTSAWRDTDMDATSTRSRLDAQDSTNDDYESHLDKSHGSSFRSTCFIAGNDENSGIIDHPWPSEPPNFKEDQERSESEDDWGNDDLWERLYRIPSCPSVGSQNEEPDSGNDASGDLHRTSPTQSSSFHHEDDHSDRDNDDFWKDVYRTSPAQSPSFHSSTQSLGGDDKFLRDVYHTSPPPSPLQRDITSSSSARNKGGERHASSGAVGAPHLNALLMGSNAEIPSSKATDSGDITVSKPSIEAQVPPLDQTGDVSSKIHERLPSAPIVLPGLRCTYPSGFTAPPATFKTGSCLITPIDVASQNAHEKKVSTHQEEVVEKEEEGEEVVSDADDDPSETLYFIDGYRDGIRPSTAPPINLLVPKISGPADGRISDTSTSMSRAQQSQNSVSSHELAEQSSLTSSKSLAAAQQTKSSYDASDGRSVASSKVSLLQSVKEGQDQEQEQQQEPKQEPKQVNQHVQQEDQQKEPGKAQEQAQEQAQEYEQEQQQEQQREQPEEERPRAKKCRFCGERCGANDGKHCGNDKNVPWPTLNLDNLEGMKAMTQMTPCDCGALPGEPGHVRTCLWYAKHYDLDADLDPDLDSISDPDSDPESDPYIGSDMDE